MRTLTYIFTLKTDKLLLNSGTLRRAFFPWGRVGCSCFCATRGHPARRPPRRQGGPQGGGGQREDAHRDQVRRRPGCPRSGPPRFLSKPVARSTRALLPTSLRRRVCAHRVHQLSHALVFRCAVLCPSDVDVFGCPSCHVRFGTLLLAL